MEKLERALTSEGQLQNTFGQASIVPLGNNRYMVTDTYDFNDQGKSFGLLDDLKRRGPDPYSIARSIGRNYGSMDQQGAPVQIIIDLNDKTNPVKTTESKRTGGLLLKAQTGREVSNIDPILASIYSKYPAFKNLGPITVKADYTRL